jgi:cytochrome bd-type quinol oxidase subunit 1
MESFDILGFFHSLLRYAVLLAIAVAALSALRGYLTKGPIIVWERAAAIIAMVLCHVQLVLGLVLYAMRWEKLHKNFAQEPPSPVFRFWKYEHIGTMLVAILLVTLGRMLSKRASTEQGKQLRVAIFYLIALVLMLWATPWPFTEIGIGRGWL